MSGDRVRASDPSAEKKTTTLCHDQYQVSYLSCTSVALPNRAGKVRTVQENGQPIMPTLYCVTFMSMRHGHISEHR